VKQRVAPVRFSTAKAFFDREVWTKTRSVTLPSAKNPNRQSKAGQTAIPIQFSIPKDLPTTESEVFGHKFFLNYDASFTIPVI
jgi:hypothetical protein